MTAELLRMSLRIVLVMTGLMTVLASASAADPGLARPNIVFIIGDDQAWSDYGFMGHPVIHTPHLDRLAKESLVFPRGYVPTSLCRASLATMITGLYPHQHKITSNDPPLPQGKTGAAAMNDPEFLKLREAMVAEFEKSPALPKLLARAGYRSHQSGKWWEGNACRCGGFSEGMTHGDPRKGGRHGDAGLVIGRQGITEVTTFITAAKADGVPFFLWYAPMMPHTPHNPPERLLAKYREKTPSIHVARYWAMCEWFDETVGELLAHLDKEGFRQNTLVIYLHDNGWIQDPDKPRYAPKSKRSPYDGGIRTPILLRWPGRVKPGQSNALVSSIDLAPTVLTAAGLSPTPAMPGINLLDADAVARRDSTFGAIFEHNAVDISNPAANLLYRWGIVDQWKLIVPQAPNVKDGGVELYDVVADPWETKNLAASQPEKVAELRRRLDAWWTPKP
jgi:arylsulfatase A-like enzyme